MISLPKAKEIFFVLSWNSLESSTSLKNTGVCFLLGTSMPIADLPGIGASILTALAASPKAISSCKFTIFETLTPGLGWISKRVTDGPLVTCNTFASTPKLIKVSSNLLALSKRSCLSSFFILDLALLFNKSSFG